MNEAEMLKEILEKVSHPNILNIEKVNNNNNNNNKIFNAVVIKFFVDTFKKKWTTTAINFIRIEQQQ